MTSEMIALINARAKYEKESAKAFKEETKKLKQEQKTLKEYNKKPKKKGLTERIFGKGKILKAPKVKVQKVNASSLLKSFANEQKNQVVKPAPERVYANDNRSLFFNNEMNKEQKNLRRF